jgi:3',5'-cyclic AMP phosphodiesterase CpdA
MRASSLATAAQPSPGRIRPPAAVRPLSPSASPTARGGAGASSPRPASAMAAKDEAAAAVDYCPPPGFSVPDPSRPVAVAIMGDLHLHPDQMPLFHAARDDLVGAMRGALAEEGEEGEEGEGEEGEGHEGGGGARLRLAQLGDLGAYECAPGTTACFEAARDYLATFGCPRALVTGNHDVEAWDVETDEQNVANWRDAFGQRHYWASDVGPATFVGLSTVRFRSNAHSVHEVYVDDAQVAWFDALLASLPADRPVVVLTHAPPQGCGLRAVQAVHVRNRCAWLCHSDRPRRFLELVERHAPRVRLWFSGHFHLSQQYPDSVSVVGACAFVQTGVAGDCHRDGYRQSRLLKLTERGYELYTVDHTSGGSRRLDVRHAWADVSVPPVVCTPPEELVCDPDAGWLCSRVACEVGAEGNAPAAAAAVGSMASSRDGGQAIGGVRWFPAGGDVLLALQDGLLVEYDLRSRAPIGLVAKVPGASEGGGDDAAVRLLDAAGAPVDPLGDGAEAAVVVICGPDGAEVERVPRNDAGGFYRIFQPNKWRLKKEQEAAAAAAAAEAERQARAKEAEAAEAAVAVNVSAR